MKQRVDQVTKRVKDFMALQWDGKSPLLLGYSGGPDSKALLYALLELGVGLHLAHVDHAWRPESAQEAACLEEEALRLGLPWHSVRLKSRPTRNAEDAARRMRLAYFQQLFHQHPFQALMLGHQRDDLAETALKRLLEGAHLTNLVGLAPVTKLEGLTVWRPLLTTPKRELLAFLKVRGLTPLIDPTNHDLRTRMRTQILPHLAELFGKEVSENLAIVSERAHELRELLERRTFALWQEFSARGVLDVRTLVERLEVRHLVQKMLSHLGARASRQVLEAVVDALIAHTPKRTFQVRGAKLAARGGVLRIMENLV
jgi:tRNA(Ile)-lysidine synthase